MLFRTITLLAVVTLTGLNTVSADNNKSESVDLTPDQSGETYQPPLPQLPVSGISWLDLTADQLPPGLEFTDGEYNDPDEDESEIRTAPLYTYWSGLPHTSYHPLRSADLYRNPQQLASDRQNCMEACPDGWLIEGVYSGSRTQPPPLISIGGFCQICKDHVHKWRLFALLLGLEYEEIQSMWADEGHDEVCFRNVLNIAQSKGLLTCADILPAAQLAMGDLICFAIADCYFDPYLISSPSFKGFSHYFNWTLEINSQGVLNARHILLHTGLNLCQTSEELRLLVSCLECSDEYTEALLQWARGKADIRTSLVCLMLYLERKGIKYERFLAVAENLLLKNRQLLINADGNPEDLTVEEYSDLDDISSISVTGLFPTACNDSGDPDVILDIPLERCHVAALVKRLDISPAGLSQILGCYDIWQEICADRLFRTTSSKLELLIERCQLRRKRTIRVRDIIVAISHSEDAGYAAANCLMDALTGKQRWGSGGQLVMSGDDVYEDTRNYVELMGEVYPALRSGKFDVFRFGQQLGIPRYLLFKIHRLCDKRKRLDHLWKLGCKLDLVTRSKMEHAFSGFPAGFWRGLPEHSDYPACKPATFRSNEPGTVLALTVDHCSHLSLSHSWHLISLCLGMPVADVLDINQQLYVDPLRFYESITWLEQASGGAIEMAHLHSVLTLLQETDVLADWPEFIPSEETVLLQGIMPEADISKGRMLASIAMKLRGKEVRLLNGLGLNRKAAPWFSAQYIPASIDILLAWERLHPGSLNKLGEVIGAGYQPVQALLMLPAVGKTGDDNFLEEVISVLMTSD
ncbi:hypothetical protein ACWJJH_01305 [Endozoicomonadaceae bacterium StTr2]